MLPILLIEDNYSLLRINTRLLQNAGYDVYPAAAYYAALDMFRLYGRFSLCISDITVGSYDPMLLIKDLKHLRELHSTPMLLMSDQMEQYHAVCDALRLPSLAKPFTDDMLLELVQRLAVSTVNESMVS